jgi:hypothetical protein
MPAARRSAPTAAALALNADNQRQIVAAFRAKRATSRDAARRLLELGLNDSQAFKRMVSTSILRQAGPDRYFLDERVWATGRNIEGNKVLRIAIALGVVVAVAALVAVVR